MRSVVITGASSGLGKGLVELYAARGWRVALMARRLDEMEQIAAQLPGGRERHLALACDVTDERSVTQAFGAVAAAWGTPDLLIANAGISLPMHALRNFSVERAKRQYETNVFGVLRAIEAVLPGMVARGQGHIVAISSLAGFRAFPGNALYCASKSAVNAHMDGLRLELLGKGVKVTTICPGFIQTPMIEKNKFPMPFTVSAADASARIYRAIERGEGVYAFPWQMRWLIRLSYLLPEALLGRMEGKAEGGKQAPASR